MTVGFWQDKVVCVTGGSAGLGREIVTEFAKHGATVFAIARDKERLDDSCNELQKKGLAVIGIAGDVTEKGAIEQILKQIKDEHSRLDMLVNNVGVSTRADVGTCPVDEYRRLMEINFFSVVQCSLAALPLLEASRGHLVNIASLAAKTAWPFMAPYSASKFPVAAFTHQLRLERPNSLHTLLVCPGPIRRDDSNRRYDHLAKDLPAEARKPGGGADVKGIEPAVLAKRIRIACEKRKPELVMPGKARVLFALSQLSPKLGDWVLRKKMK